MVRTYGDFEMHTAGLLISTKYPFLGATPDGVVSCDFRGSGLLEVKFPYKYRDINPSDIADVNFYLQTRPDGTRVLNQTHEHYYQVQGQMAIWNKEYCDFVCWTSSGVARPGPTRACALPSTFQALPSAAQQTHVIP